MVGNLIMVYYECYEKGKLVHTCTYLNDPEELKYYMEEFPERTIKKIDKIFYHHIEIYETSDDEGGSGYTKVGKIKVSDENFENLIRIPNLGAGFSPIEGCYSITFTKVHIKKAMSYGERQGQLTLFDFGITSKKTRKKNKI